MTAKVVALFTLLAVAYVLIHPAVDLPDSTGSARISLAPALVATSLPTIVLVDLPSAPVQASERLLFESSLYETHCSRLC